MKQSGTLKRILAVMLTLILTMGASGIVAVASEEKMEISWLGPVPPLEDDTWGELTFEEIFDVDVKIIRAETEEQKSALYASGAVPDYIDVASGNIGAVAALNDQGLIAEIPVELIQEHMPRYYAQCIAIDPLFFNYTIIDGQNMAIPRLASIGSVPLGNAIRADWLKNVGIDKVPETMEELEAAFVAFRNDDPDQNGQQDTYALSAGGGTKDGNAYELYFPSIFSIYGVSPFYWREDGNGGLEYGFTTEDFKEALKLLARWYEMELIDPEFVTDMRRTSSEDISLKFSAGRVGYMDNTSFDDYQWDNDGHVSAKWVANSPEWQAYFEENAEADDLYKYVNTTDFDDSFLDPYYINMNPVSRPDGTPGQYIAGGNISTYFCIGAQVAGDEAKLVKILQILESLAMDEEVYVNHFGPEGEEWVWNEDKTQRIYNVDWTNHPNYHPQGQKSGKGWCLWPMYWANPDFLLVVSGPRQTQRFEYERDVFNSFPSFTNTLRSALPGETENPELTSTYVRDYMVKAIRGEVNIDETFDSTIQTWMDMGGAEMTEQATEWYRSIQ